MERGIERGSALVLVGPQGSGKTLLARKLASQLGIFVHVDVSEVEDRKVFKRVLDSVVSTVIVEGVPKNEATLVHLKALITNGTHPRIRPGKACEIVPAPNFVFCTGDAEPLKHLDGRRFRVVHLDVVQAG